jgi:hypothetical protein
VSHRETADPWHVNDRFTAIAVDRVRKDDRHKIAPHVVVLEQQRSGALQLLLGDRDGNEVRGVIDAAGSGSGDAIVKAVHTAVERDLAKLKPS